MLLLKLPKKNYRNNIIHYSDELFNFGLHGFDGKSVPSVQSVVFTDHSFFNASAGFVRAAFKVCQRTDKKAINIPRSAAKVIIQP